MGPILTCQCWLYTFKGKLALVLPLVAQNWIHMRLRASSLILPPPKATLHELASQRSEILHCFKRWAMCSLHHIASSLLCSLHHIRCSFSDLIEFVNETCRRSQVVRPDPSPFGNVIHTIDSGGCIPLKQLQFMTTTFNADKISLMYVLLLQLVFKRQGLLKVLNAFGGL